MSGVIRLRFGNLAIQGEINVFEPIPRIRKAGIFLEIRGHLIANQIGVNSEKHCGQENLACSVLATEDVLRPQHECRNQCRSRAEGDFLPPVILSQEKRSKRHHYYDGGEPKARSRRCQQQ